MNKKPSLGVDEDALYQTAARIIRDYGRASASILQRRLRIGYARACYLLDLMKENGVVDGAGTVVKKR